MKVYFISGIAADQRLFRHIRLPNGYEAVHLDWITPQRAESISQYAIRLAEKIDPETPFVLVGLSLGGIIATEIAKSMHPAACILISSVPQSSQLPPYYHFARRLRIHKILPSSVFKASATLKRLFTRESLSDKKLLIQMIRKTDSNFIKWAINAVLEWKNEEVPSRLYQIHGTRDEVFPIGFTKPTHVIRGGGHTLVMTESEEVNKILQDLLSFILTGNSK